MKAAKTDIIGFTFQNQQILGIGVEIWWLSGDLSSKHGCFSGDVMGTFFWGHAHQGPWWTLEDFPNLGSSQYTLRISYIAIEGTFSSLIYLFFGWWFSSSETICQANEICHNRFETRTGIVCGNQSCVEHLHLHRGTLRNSEGYPLVNWHSYWKFPFIVDLPIKNGDFPWLC